MAFHPCATNTACSVLQCVLKAHVNKITPGRVSLLQWECCIVDNMPLQDLQRATDAAADAIKSIQGPSHSPQLPVVSGLAQQVHVFSSTVYLGHYFGFGKPNTHTHTHTPAGHVSMWLTKKELNLAWVHCRGPPTGPAAQSHNCLFVASGTSFGMSCCKV